MLSLPGKSADTSALKAEIDRLVYGLYEIKEDEVLVVGGFILQMDQ